MFRQDIKLHFALIILTLMSFSGYAAQPSYIEVNEKHKVCMVNDFYNPLADFSSLSVILNNKTYYGCCGGCKKTLTSNTKIRSAIDPYSRATVDKAVAYIVADINNNGKVLYFENKNNFDKYSKAK